MTGLRQAPWSISSYVSEISTEIEVFGEPLTEVRVHLENPWQEETWGGKLRDMGRDCGEEPSWDRSNRSGGEGTEEKGHGLFPEHNHSEMSLQQRKGGELQRPGPEGLSIVLRDSNVTHKATRNQREKDFVSPLWWKLEDGLSRGGPNSVHNSCYSSPRRNGLNQGWPQTSRYF